jgi:alkanesulfonate monooxygenase SsuD/methylene tetrahydromethanopterin reductase-like flavin-dependent oxidoreductase (luciferase family)
MALSLSARTKPLKRLGKRARKVDEAFQALEPDERTANAFIVICACYGISEADARERWGSLIAILEAKPKKVGGRRGR